jgi:hypothetical protein
MAGEEEGPFCAGNVIAWELWCVSVPPGAIVGGGKLLISPVCNNLKVSADNTGRR